MRAYAEFLSKSFSRNMAYRSDVWLRVVGNIVTIWVQVAIWRALIGAGTTEVSVEEMITYSIVTTTIMILEMSGVLSQVDSSLKSGQIAVYLLKPVRFPLYLFFEELGSVGFRFLFTLIPTALIAGLWFGLQFPQPHLLVPFGVALFLSIILSFAFGYMVSLLAFWVMTTFSLRWIYWGLRTLFSGAFLPLWFFSGSWETIAHMLPFQYLGYVPAAIYLGKIDAGEIVTILAIGVLWAVLIYGCLAMIWRFTIRKLIIQGG